MDGKPDVFVIQLYGCDLLWALALAPENRFPGLQRVC